ncbi:MAG TPA: DUF47 family protein [Saprospiraceae bacterium]|nr:DUF47 family protein [Saprospiraceae bacterium]
MAIGSFFSSFLTRNNVFYELFDKVAVVVDVMGNLANDLSLEKDKDLQAKIIYQIKEKEKNNDELVGKLFIELSKNFITPFDREDIHELATALDDICDNIYAASKKIHLYKVDPTIKEIQELSAINRESCLLVSKIIFDLKDMKNMKQMIESIAVLKQLETQSDDVFDRTIQRLFDSPEVDAKEFLKLREIYSKLESVTDKCEDAANVGESILAKYA